MTVDLCCVPQSDCPDIALNAGFSGNHVRPCPAPHDAWVYGYSGLKIGHFADVSNLMGEFDNGTCSVVEINPGVGGFPLHRYEIAPNSLTRGLQFAGKAGAGFEYQNCFAPALFCSGALTRLQAPGLFVGNYQERYFGRNADIELAEQTNRGNEEREARFHIEHAGAPEPSPGFPEWLVRECASRTNRIGMSQAQNGLRRFPPGQLEIKAQAGRDSSAANPFRVREITRLRDDEIQKTVQIHCRIGGRLALDQGPDEVYSFNALLRRMAEERVHWLIS